MKHLFLLTILVLGSAGFGFGQTSGTQPSTPGAQAAPAPAPLPDEKTLVISDTSPEGPANGATPAPAEVTVWDFVKMFVILLLVLGMILGFVWFLRRLSGQGGTNETPIQVLHTQTLGGSRSLQVVEVGDEILLLGVGDSGVTLVKELTGTEAGDAFRLAASKRRPSSKGFGDLLGSLLGAKPRIRPDVAEPVENSSDFLKKQRERLKKM